MEATASTGSHPRGTPPARSGAPRGGSCAPRPDRSRRCRNPRRVLPDARVGVLVEGRPVKAARALLGEVRRHPVQEHPQVVGVAGVHKRLQVLRRPVAGRGVVPRDQALPRRRRTGTRSPASAHVGVPRVAHVGGQVPGQLAVGQGPVALLRDATPGAGVHLVGGEGPVGPLAPRRPAIQSPSVQGKARKVARSWITEAVPGGLARRA